MYVCFKKSRNLFWLLLTESTFLVEPAEQGVQHEAQFQLTYEPYETLLLK